MRAVALLVVAALMAASCGSIKAGAGARPTPGGSAPSLPVFTRQLAQAGIPVVASFSQAAPRWQFTVFQAAVMDQQLANHQGFVGSELDAEVPMAAGGSSVSFLIAAWITGAKTPRSGIVAAWMGRQDWSLAPQVVFPTAALALFSIDMAEHIAADTSKPTAPTTATASASLADTTANRPVLVDIASSPCSAVADFISDAMIRLFDALRLSPAFLGQSGPLRAIGGFLASIWNSLVSLAQKATTGIVANLTAPITAAISVAVAAVSLISQVGAVMGAWNLKVVVDPPGAGSIGQDRYAVGTEPDHHNTVVLSASSLLDKVPAVLADCAATLNPATPLPTTLDPGTAITWKLQQDGHAAIFPNGLNTIVAKDGTSSLAWSTGRERSGGCQQVTRMDLIRTTVANPASTTLDKFAQQLIQSAVNAVAGNVLAPIVAQFLHQLADPILAAIQTRVGGSGFDQTAVVAFLVTHHEAFSAPPCSPNGPNQPAPPTTPTTKPLGLPLCTFYAPAELHLATEWDAGRVSAVIPHAASRLCLYNPADMANAGNHGGEAFFILFDSATFAHAYFAKIAPPYTRLAGIGDEAVSGCHPNDPENIENDKTVNCDGEVRVANVIIGVVADSRLGVDIPNLLRTGSNRLCPPCKYPTPQ